MGEGRCERLCACARTGVHRVEVCMWLLLALVPVLALLKNPPPAHATHLTGLKHLGNQGV